MFSQALPEKEYEKSKIIEGQVLQASELVANEIIKRMSAELKYMVDKIERHEKILNSLFNINLLQEITDEKQELSDDNMESTSDVTKEL